MTPEDTNLDIDCGTLLKLANAALANAHEYAAQADMLAERGWFGRARSFAILGREEASKAGYPG